MYSVTGTSSCAKIPRHTSAHVVAIFENEMKVLSNLERLNCESLPTAKLRLRANEPRLEGASPWPVLLVSPVGMPLTRAVCEVDDPLERLQLARIVMREVVDIMERFHAAGHVHCDLRPENIVLVLHNVDGIRKLWQRIVQKYRITECIR